MDPSLELVNVLTDVFLSQIRRAALASDAARAVHVHRLVLEEFPVLLQVLRPITELPDVRGNGSFEASLKMKTI